MDPLKGGVSISQVLGKVKALRHTLIRALQPVIEHRLHKGPRRRDQPRSERADFAAAEAPKLLGLRAIGWKVALPDRRVLAREPLDHG